MLFDTLPYVTTATVYGRTTSTRDDYGWSVPITGSAATSTGFFQLGSSGAGSQGDTVQSEPGFNQIGGARFYVRPASVHSMEAGDTILQGGIRYIVMFKDPVLSGDAVDHYKFTLSRAVGVR